MSVSNAALAEGATISVTGGTSKTFGVSGAKIANGVQIVDSSVADIRTRPLINLQAYPASFNSISNTWTMDKRDIKCVRPFLDGTKQEFPSIRIVENFTASMTAAQKLELRKMAVQSLIDTDFDAFHDSGTLI